MTAPSILIDIHIVEFDSAAGLYFDPPGYFLAGEDPVSREGAILRP
jgi:hypothetical protein